MENNFKFDLNAKVEDTVTRFAGRVIARCDYLGGTNRYLVVTQIDRKVESEWFDEGRLIVWN